MKGFEYPKGSEFKTCFSFGKVGEANKAAMMASYQPLMQQASEFGRIQLTRQFARIVGLDKELVNMVYDYPTEYHQATMDLELLNNDEDP